MLRQDLYGGHPVPELPFEVSDAAKDNSYCETLEQNDKEILNKVIFSDGTDSEEMLFYQGEDSTIVIDGTNISAEDAVKNPDKYGFSLVPGIAEQDGVQYRMYTSPIDDSNVCSRFGSISGGTGVAVLCEPVHAENDQTLAESVFNYQLAVGPSLEILSKFLETPHPIGQRLPAVSERSIPSMVRQRSMRSSFPM